MPITRKLPKWLFGGYFEARLFFAERVAWRHHKRRAKDLFQTKQLKTEIRELKASLSEEAHGLFSPVLEACDAERTRISERGRLIERRLNLFQRNLYEEKRAAYASLDRIKADITEAFDDKSEAYERFNSEDSYIEHWHARSKSSLPAWGKSGAIIPRHNLFGMSHGKRERAEARRDDAGHDIAEAKSAISQLKTEKQKIVSEINFLKAAIQEVKSLKGQGVSAASLKNELVELSSANVRLDVRRRDILANRGRHEACSHWARQIAVCQREIDEIDKKRKEYLDSFWSDSHREALRAACRRAWQSPAI